MRDIADDAAPSEDATPRPVPAEGSGETLPSASRAADGPKRPRRKKKRTPRSANRQLRRPLPFDDPDARAAELSLERRIRAHLSAGTLAVTLTDNRYTMISVRRESGPHYRVRLHHMFAAAGPVVTRALARYIGRNDPRASRLLGEFIDEHQHKVRPRSRRGRPSIVTRGEHHDLQEIFDDLNQSYFGGKIDAVITWGQRTGKPRRRNSIKMGSYSVEDRLIRIHRSLDRAFVPRFFVAWIVYHEMLHQVHDAPVVNGRRQFHTRAFLEDEARFEHYVEARAWELAHLDELLTY